MKTFKTLVVAAVAIPALAGPALAQAPKPATPPVAEEAAKAASKSLTGEFVAADHTAKTVTVKHMVDKKPVQMTFTVEDSALASLGQWKAGDHVKVTYVEMGDKRIIRSIVKA